MSREQNPDVSIAIDESALEELARVVSGFAKDDFDELQLNSKNPALIALEKKINETSARLKFRHSTTSKTLQRAEDIQESARLGSWDLWLNTDKVAFDNQWCDMLGLPLDTTPQEIATWDARIHPDDREKAFLRMRAYLNGTTDVFEDIQRVRHADGSWVWILNRGRISEWDKQGNPVRFTGIQFNISTFKEMEELSKEIQKVAKIGGWAWDLRTQQITWTDETYHIHGLLPGSPMGKELSLSFFPTHEHARLEECVAKCRQGKSYCEVFEFKDAKGRHKWVEAIGQPILDANGAVHKLVGTFQDVTQRRQSEMDLSLEQERLKESQSILAQTLEALPMMVFAKDIKNDFRFSIWNHAAEKIVGMSAKDCLGKSDFDLFARAEAEFFRAKDLEASETKNVIVIPEEKISSPSGVRTLRTQKTIVRDSKGNPIYLLGVSEDVTQVILAKQELEQAKNHLSHLIQLVPCGIFEMGTDGHCIFVNETWTRMTGFSSEDALGWGWMQAIHSEDRPAMITEWEKSVVEKRPFDHVFRYLKKDGSVIFVHGRSVAVVDSTGAVKGHLGSIQDVTEQLRTHERFEQTSKELNQFFNVALELLGIAGADGRFKKLNPAFMQILGYAEADLISQSLIDFAHPDDIPITLEKMKALSGRTTTVHFENRYRCKNRSYKVLSWTGSSDPVTGNLYFAARDITEIRMRESELRHVTEAISRSAIMAVTDRKGLILEVNDNFCNVSGFRREELLGQDHRVVSSGAHPKEFFRDMWNVISSGKVWSGEIQNKAKDGNPYFVQTVISPLMDMKGEVQRYLAIRFDVTKHRESERLLEEAQRAAKMGSWTFDCQTSEIRWSLQMYKLFPVNPTKSVPSYKKHFEKVHPEDQEYWKKTIEDSLRDGRPFRMRFRSIFSEKPLWIEMSGEGKRDMFGKVVSLGGTCQDVSDLVEAEQVAKRERIKAVHNAKLASLGEMSAGIAHEINNPLAIIKGTANLISELGPDREVLRRKAAVIERASDRIAKIVSGLRKFSRSSEQPNYQKYSIASIVNEAVSLTGVRARRASVEVSVSIQSEARVMCDEIEIEQVMVNLINNGIDAVQNLQKKWVQVEVLDDRDQVVIRVRDAGQGIVASVQEKLFQPFFTTKDVGEGTGLGLSIVKGILDEHRATIELLVDDPNTCFEVRFKNGEVQQDVA